MDKYIELMTSSPELFVNSDSPNSIKIITDIKEIQKIENTKRQKLGVIYKDPYVMLLKDAVIFPNGSTGAYIRILSPKKGLGTVILPLKNGKILLVNHYRHALRRFMWELPRGFAEDNASAIENAKRELAEECGVKATDCEILGKISPDSGLLGSEAWVVKINFAGENECTDDKEAIEGHIFVTPSELLQMIAQNQITDAFTISAMMLAISKGCI